MDNDIEVEKDEAKKKLDMKEDQLHREDSAFAKAEQERSENLKVESAASENEKIAQAENDLNEQAERDSQVQNALLKNDEDLPAFVPNTESEVMLFLADELEPLRRAKRVNVYDLETEYAKTRKNKLWSVWIMLALTFLVIVLATVFTVGGLSASNEKIDVSFSSFKDLDLQNLFNQLQRTQEKFEEATKRSAELRGHLETRLAQAAMRRDNDLNLLKNTRLSRLIVANRTNEIQASYDDELAAIHSEFDADLAAAEAEAKQYEEQLKSYDSENVARAQKWEQQMDSERQVYQLERERLVESYEARLETARQNLEATRQKNFEEKIAVTNEITKRYEGELDALDPVIKDSETLAVINSLAEVYPQKFDAEAIIALDENISENFAAALRQAQADYDNLELLYSHSTSIPNRNTMKDVSVSEKKLSDAMVNRVAQAAIAEIQERTSSSEDLEEQLRTAEIQRDSARAAIQAYVGILNSSVVDENIAGFVLDPFASYGVAVFVRSVYLNGMRQDGGTKVEIYDGDVLVATGAFLGVSGSYYISLDDDSDREKISVGNTFIVSENY